MEKFCLFVAERCLQWTPVPDELCCEMMVSRLMFTVDAVSRLGL